MTDFSDKTSARKHFLASRLALPSQAIDKASDILCEKILELEEFSQADTVLLYFPVKNELNLLPIAKAALKENKKVAFPISITKNCTLEFREISSLEELISGAYGIPEPPESAQIAAFSEKSFCIVPALAFDKKGFRIGYGKGYYDRFLSSFKGISVGAVLSSHICDSLPIESTDLPVNIIITETGVTRIK